MSHSALVHVPTSIILGLTEGGYQPNTASLPCIDCGPVTLRAARTLSLLSRAPGAGMISGASWIGTMTWFLQVHEAMTISMRVFAARDPAGFAETRRNETH